jgi:hypothetical protein
MKREKRKLQLQLHQYQNEFVAQHGRKVQYLEDRLPVQKEYERYKVCAQADRGDGVLLLLLTNTPLCIGCVLGIESRTCRNGTAVSEQSSVNQSQAHTLSPLLACVVCAISCTLFLSNPQPLQVVVQVVS